MSTKENTNTNILNKTCPQCAETLTHVGSFWICPIHGQQVDEKVTGPLRIFLSYGHDANEELVKIIKSDLEARDHDVWFDRSEIKAGDDWRRAITEGIVNSHRIVCFLSKYSTQNPGVCRDEIAIAIGVKGGNIQTILVESEDDVQPPVNIGHIQWLDMHDWKQHKAAGGIEWSDWYQTKFAEIIRVVENKESRRFAGEIETLNTLLKPIQSEARIYSLLNKGFFGRTWLFKAIEQWRVDIDHNSRIFWIIGDPGVGKSAFAAQLAHTRSDVVIAAQFVEWDKPDHSDPRRIILSIAFQLATRLQDYRKLILTLPEISKLDGKDAFELFDYLLCNPLNLVIGGGHERYLIVIDAIDETGKAGRNPLVEMLAYHASRLPSWLGIVITSRPESAVRTPLQDLKPYILDTRSEANRSDLRDYILYQIAPWFQNCSDSINIVDKIIEKSEGVFLYVERFCDEVQRNCISLDQPEHFPQGLGGIFYHWFQRQFPDIARFRKNVRPAMRVILAALDPLPLVILQRLFIWTDEELRDFTCSLGSLYPTIKEPNGEVIKPYHKSLADWQTDEGKAGIYFVSLKEGHQLLAEYGWKQFKTNVSGMSSYSLRNLPSHLAVGKRKADLEKLLLSPNYVIQMCEFGLIHELVGDYELATSTHFQIIGQALRLSMQAIINDPNQVIGQLVGRLFEIGNKKINNFLERLVSTYVGKALVPHLSTLHHPRSDILFQWRIELTASVCRLKISENEKIIAVIKEKDVDFYDILKCSPIASDEAIVFFNNIDWNLWRSELPVTVVPNQIRDDKWVNSTPPGPIRAKCFISRESFWFGSNPHYFGHTNLYIGNFNQNGFEVEKSSAKGTSYLSEGMIAPTLSSDLKMVICGGIGGQVKMWDINSRKLTFDGLLGNLTITAITQFPKSKLLAFLASDGTLGVGYPININKIRKKKANIGSRPEALWISRDGKQVIVGCENGNISSWDTVSGEVLYTHSFCDCLVRRYSVTNDFITTGLKVYQYHRNESLPILGKA